jgi:hypothetical protein
VIVNVLAVALGGVLGTVFSKKLSTRFTTELNKVFGVCAIGMGISSVPLMQNMPAVTSLVAVPQAAVFFALFFAAKAIYPLTTATSKPAEAFCSSQRAAASPRCRTSPWRT